jgi:predicted DNA-binding transcriptional regulator YafY
VGKNKSAADTLLRQWHMLRAIPRYPTRISVREIRARLETAGYAVTARTVQRDLIELSEAFPLYSDERARPYGWSWQKGAPLFDLPNLSAQEALTFAMVEDYLRPLLPNVLLDQLQSYFTAARKRLASDGPKRGSSSWLGKIAVVPPTQALIPPAIDPQVQKTVTDALLQDRKLGVKYRRKGERELRGYVLSPLGLIQRGPVTYLLACIGDHEDPRSFVLHRVERASMLEEPAVRPKGFELATYLANTGVLHFGSGKTIKFDALFEAASADHLQETPLSDDQSIEDLGNGWVRLRASVLDTPQLRWWLLGIGQHVEVTGPASLRREFAATTASMAARYTG